MRPITVARTNGATASASRRRTTGDAFGWSCAWPGWPNGYGVGGFGGGGTESSNTDASGPNAAWNGFRRSIGIGMTNVEFCSAATSVTVWR